MLQAHETWATCHALMNINLRQWESYKSIRVVDFVDSFSDVGLVVQVSYACSARFTLLILVLLLVQIKNNWPQGWNQNQNHRGENPLRFSQGIQLASHFETRELTSLQCRCKPGGWTLHWKPTWRAWVAIKIKLIVYKNFREKNNCICS